MYLRDEQFIKWKPTVINWLFGLAFLGSHFFGQRTAIERMLSGTIVLPQPIWRRLNGGWTVFFFLLGAPTSMSCMPLTATPGQFQTLCMLGLTLAFVILQSVYLARYIENTENNQ